MHTAHFTDYLTRVPVDFQLGVITTDIDVDSPGMLVDNTILTRDSSQIASRFANLISLDEGSRDEYGFETTLAALDPSGINGDVLNANADLEIVFFSDEDEQSDMSVDDFVNTLASYRPTANIVVNTISGDPPEGCASIVGAADRLPLSRSPRDDRWFGENRSVLFALRCIAREDCFESPLGWRTPLR